MATFADGSSGFTSARRLRNGYDRLSVQNPKTGEGAVIHISGFR